jgi:alanyl-tRNA synthetase
LEVVSLKNKTAVVLDVSCAYAELGGQVGDTGELRAGADLWRVQNTQKSGSTWLHFVEGDETPQVGQKVTLALDLGRRRAIERHHTVTHLLHWALHEVVSREASQKGSYVGPEKLTFDFSSGALTPSQVRDVERLVNERIVENSAVSWTEVPYAEVKPRADIQQFFGDKYGDVVRVVQIGGKPGTLDGYSMELCGGTHTRGTGEIGLFRIVAESAIAAGVRRIEAAAGLSAYEMALSESDRLRSLASTLGAPLGEVERKLEAMLAQQRELEKTLKAALQREASQRATSLLAGAETLGATPAIVQVVPGASGDDLQGIAEALKGRFEGVLFLFGTAPDQIPLVSSVSPGWVAKFQAGKLVQTAAAALGGKGGGRPENARGAGKDPARIETAMAQIKSTLSQ